jgi:hypothetical protein
MMRIVCTFRVRTKPGPHGSVLVPLPRWVLRAARIEIGELMTIRTRRVKSGLPRLLLSKEASIP